MKLCRKEIATPRCPRSASSRASRSTCGDVDLLLDRAVGERALGHVEAQVARHERRGQVDVEVVDLVAALARDLDRVAEPVGREQRRRRALALDDRVRDERRAVHDPRDLRDRDAVRLERLREDRLDRARGLVRRRQRLADRDEPVLADDAEIGERAADVDADAQTPAFKRASRPSGTRRAEHLDLRRALLEEHATVDVQLRARHVGGVVRRGEHGGAGHVLGEPGAAERHGGVDRGEPSRVGALARLDHHPRHEAHDADPVRAEVERERARQRLDAALGGVVGDHPAVRAGRRRRSTC